MPWSLTQEFWLFKELAKLCPSASSFSPFSSCLIVSPVFQCSASAYILYSLPVPVLCCRAQPLCAGDAVSCVRSPAPAVSFRPVQPPAASPAQGLMDSSHFSCPSKIRLFNSKATSAEYLAQWCPVWSSIT